jgi:hypothetical protein
MRGVGYVMLSRFVSRLTKKWEFCNAVQFTDSLTFWTTISLLSSGLKSKLSFLPASAGLLLDSIFVPENGGCTFLQNVRLSQNYMAL